MRPALSSLDEFPQFDFTQQYLSYSVPDTFHSPAITVLPTQVIRRGYYLSEINYDRLFLAYSVALSFIPAFRRGTISRYNDIPSILRKMEEILVLCAVLIRTQNEFAGIIDGRIFTGCGFSLLSSARLRGVLRILFSPSAPE